MNENKIEVIVWVFTYNHKDYIKECLDSIIIQKTTFGYEVIVHDDASNDGTEEIVREYAAKYPQIIKPMYEKENQYSKNEAYTNYLLNSRTTAKYYAICDGDDYWIDPYKLQKQYTILESDPSISMCHHNFYQLYPDGRKELREKKVPQRQDLLSLASFNNVQTLTMFFRNNPPLIPKELEDKPQYTAFWAMRLAEIGDIYYLDEPLAVYRYNEGGIYGMQNGERRFKMAVSNIDLMIQWYSILGDIKVATVLKKRARKLCYSYIIHFLRRFNFSALFYANKKLLSYYKIG